MVNKCGGIIMEHTGMVSIDILSIIIWLISIIVLIAIVWVAFRLAKKRILKDVEILIEKKINEHSQKKA